MYLYQLNLEFNFKYLEYGLKTKNILILVMSSFEIQEFADSVNTALLRASYPKIASISTQITGLIFKQTNPQSTSQLPYLLSADTVTIHLP